MFWEEKFGASYGCCASDTFHLGLRGVALGGKAIRNGTQIDVRRPSECSGWNAIVAKARADAKHIDDEYRLRAVAESLTLEELKADLESMKRWANSLRKTTQLKTGLHDLTQAAAS